MLFRSRSKAFEVVRMMFGMFVEVRRSAGLRGGGVKVCFQGLGANGTYHR